MTGRNEFNVLCTTIKTILKQKKITYRALAQNVGISESGLKKILGGKDASFSRLTQIADSLDLTLSDLLAENDSGTFEDVSFTPEQEKFFLVDRGHFSLYWLLMYERVSFEAATRKLGFAEKDARKILKKMEALNLVRIKANGQIKLPKISRIRWVGEGPFVEKIYQNWAAKIIRDLARPASKLNANELFIIRYLKLHENTYSELLRAQRDLEIEYIKKAVREMNLNLPKMKMVRWVTAIDDRSFVE